MVQFQSIRPGSLATSGRNGHGNVCFCGCKPTFSGQGQKAPVQPELPVAQLNADYAKLAKQSWNQIQQSVSTAVTTGGLKLGDAIQLLTDLGNQRLQTSAAAALSTDLLTGGESPVQI